MARAKLAIDGHVYRPRYLIEAFRNGNPAKRIKGVDFSSVLSIQTSKNITDVAGTFNIVFKDPRILDSKSGLRQMDVVRIYLGRSWAGIDPVFVGVVDTVTQSGAGGVNSADQTVTVSGRCVAKYLQVTSMFLPVWDANSLLPTTLTFGVASSGQDALPSPHPEVGPTPRAIFGYLLRTYCFGRRKVVGAGIPNARYWIDYRSRMGSLNKFVVPFVQFNEDTLANALKTFEVPGFAEAWVDELGRVVYRRPQWDAQASFSLWTGDMISWQFAESDEAVATYVEVVPSGLPATATGMMQALLTGRAPVPSNYVNDTAMGKAVDRRFIIDTKGGKVTAKGAKNHWWQLQRRLGVRPQQVTSPMLGTQEQAQIQAQGLLKFYSRFTKTAQATIPGDPRVRLGTSIHVYGVLDGHRISRSYYIEGVQHDYQEGQGYTTTLALTHGKDPGDPDWGSITVPRFTAQEAAKDGGVAWYGPSPYAALFGDMDGGASDTAPTPSDAEQGYAGPDSVEGLEQVRSGDSYTDPTRGTFRISDAQARHLVWWTKGRIAVAKWIAVELIWAKKRGWDGVLTTGFRTDAHQTKIWDSGTRPAAKPLSRGGGGSNHSFTTYPRSAVDVADWQKFKEVIANYDGTYRLKWFGAGDVVHFSGTGG